MALGIRLLLRRNLGFQFFAADEKNDFRWDPRNAGMQALGAFDYLAWKPFDQLSELDDPIDEPTGPTSGGTELVLFPSSVNADQLGRTISNFDTAFMGCIIRLHISSLAFDAVPTLADAESICTHRGEELFQNLLDETRKVTGHDFSISLWATLGGPDLVCLAFPRSPRDLSFLNVFVCLARSRSVIELAPTAKNIGHAFCGVQANLLFQFGTGLHENVFSDSFASAEADLGLHYPCRLTVGPGHEQEVLSRIDDWFRKKELDRSPLRSALMCWGHRSIQVVFSELRQLVSCIQAANGNDGEGNDAHAHAIHAVRTTVAMGEPSFALLEGAFSHPPQMPQLSPELTTLLESIGERLGRFGRNYLGEAHRQELERIFHTFKTAFRRNDRAGAVRDLLPFFDQFARSVSTDAWSQLYDGTVDAEIVASEIDIAFSYIWRALRNRTEHRGEPLDPAFPTTIANGTDNIVNAYSVASWVACSVLVGNQNIPDDEGCAKDRFALSICTGTDGVVTLMSLFSTVFASRVIEANNDGEWNAPLYLLRISGPVLYLPEIAFALTLHEMAEFSNWTRLPPHAVVNETVNQVAIEDFCARVTEQVTRCEGEEIREASNLIRISIELLALEQGASNTETDFMMSSLVRQLSDAANAEPLDLVRTGELERFLLRKSRPTDYLRGLQSRFDQITRRTIKTAVLLQEEETVNDQNLNERAIPCWAEYLLRDSETSIDFATVRRQHETFSISMRETISDVAMTSALAHLLNLEKHQMTNQLNYLFVKLIECSVYSNRRQLKQYVGGLVVRWALQLLCFHDPEDVKEFLRVNIEPHQEAITSAMNKGLATTGIGQADEFRFFEWLEEDWTNFVSQCGGCISSVVGYEPAICARLRDAVEAIDGFADFEDHPAISSIVADFESLWNVAVKSDSQRPEDGDDLERIRYNFTQKMWAKAQKFRVANVFDGPIE